MTAKSQNTSSDKAVSRVWLVRGGARGEDEALALENGLAIVRFSDIPDLTGVSDRDDVLERVRQANPGSKDNRSRNLAGQMNAFVLLMSRGDIVALPLKTRPGRIALGRVAGEYQYQSIDGVMRHTRQVEWLRPDVPRSDFEQDMLYSLGAFLTVCRIRRNHAERRLAFVLAGSRDPGIEMARKEVLSSREVNVEFDQDTPETLDISQIALDQILDHIRLRFPGHSFARLVDAVLEAEGYFTQLSPAGPDGGVDILAGSGPLGFEGPRLCVQVKATASAVDVTVLRGLIGTMQTFKADQGLLVSWSGFTRDLEREARQGFFTVRLWNAEDLISSIFRNYDRLSEQIQSEIPLERVWTLVREDSEF